jgi:dTDP-4-amino-4,6-dideoxygalactose transaminase
MNVEFYRHSLTDEDIQHAGKVLHSLFLTTGPVTAEFEKKFSRFTGLDHTIALSSCTAALHLALLALGIGPGDEVITTPLTFIATATPILHTGAEVVFVDVEPDTGLINPRLIKSAITPRTKAILPVHLYGTMADMKALRAIADRHHLYIIEDSAHCIEGERDGVRPGYLSDAACYSFYATKNLTCGEGGALATNDPIIAQKVRTLRQHGMSKEAADRYHGLYKHWDMIDLGWKYNMNDIHAALLVRQIDRLEVLWKRRKEIWEQYDSGLRDIPGITLPSVKGKSALHLYTVWVPPERRDAILHALQRENIGVAVNYRAIHMLTYLRKRYQFCPEDFPVAYSIGRRTISLPFYPKLSEPEVTNVIETLKSVIGL